MHDRKNMAREWEEMKHLNDQLLTQITPSKIPESHLHRQRGLLLPRPKVANILKAGSGAGQTLQLHWNNPTVDRARHIPARGISTITRGGRLKSLSVTKVSTRLCKSESKKRGCRIKADSKLSPPIHPTPPSPGIPKKFMIPTFNCYSIRATRSSTFASI